MKDLGETSIVIGIEINRDRSLGLLDLSQKAYILLCLKDLIWMVVHLMMLLLFKKIDFLTSVHRMIRMHMLLVAVCIHRFARALI